MGLGKVGRRQLDSCGIAHTAVRCERRDVLGPQQPPPKGDAGRDNGGGSIVPCRAPYLLDRLTDHGVEPASASVQMLDDGGSHPRVPEFLQVLSSASDSTLVTLAGEEFSDLVRHIDELVG